MAGLRKECGEIGGIAFGGSTLRQDSHPMVRARACALFSASCHAAWCRPRQRSTADSDDDEPEASTIMSKGMDSKKTTKKKPEKTLKEKRAAKDLKKKTK